MLEIEAKYYLGREADARALVERWGLNWKEGTFEVNRIFDFDDGRLRQAGAMVRVRQRGEQAWLTYKERTDVEVDMAKVRLELDSLIGDASAVGDILTRLGLSEVHRYERFRSRYPVEEAHIEMDHLPGGWFCEIEGPPEVIRRWVVRGGLEDATPIVWSYPEIFERIKRACGVERHDWTTATVSEHPSFVIPGPGSDFWKAD